MAIVVKNKIDYCKKINGLTYKVIQTQRDVDRAIDFFFDVFLRDEPLTKSAGGLKEEDKRHPNILKMMSDTLMDGVSLMVVDENDKLIGIRASSLEKREDAGKKSKNSMDDLIKTYSIPFGPVFYIWEEPLWIPDVFEAYPDKNLIYFLFALGTLPDYRGQGIAGNLVKCSFEMAKDFGCDCTVVVATNPHSVKIFNKLGMTEINRAVVNDLKNCKVDGQDLFTEAVEAVALYKSL